MRESQKRDRLHQEQPQYAAEKYGSQPANTGSPLNETEFDVLQQKKLNGYVTKINPNGKASLNKTMRNELSKTFGIKLPLAKKESTTTLIKYRRY